MSLSQTGSCQVSREGLDLSSWNGQNLDAAELLSSNALLDVCFPCCCFILFVYYCCFHIDIFPPHMLELLATAISATALLFVLSLLSWTALAHIFSSVLITTFSVKLSLSFRAVMSQTRPGSHSAEPLGRGLQQHQHPQLIDLLSVIDKPALYSVHPC